MRWKERNWKRPEALDHLELGWESLGLKTGSRSSRSPAKDLKVFLVKGTGKVQFCLFLFCFRQGLTMYLRLLILRLRLPEDCGHRCPLLLAVMGTVSIHPNGCEKDVWTRTEWESADGADATVRVPGKSV